jgi:predicted nucleotidyltransferase
MTQEIIAKSNKLLREYDIVVFAYLFGSYTHETQTEKSDVDIALYLKKDTLDIRLTLSYELSKILNREVDLVILNSIKNMYLLDSIFQDNILLKESPLRMEFEWKKEHDILDYKAFKRMLDAA